MLQLVYFSSLRQTEVIRSEFSLAVNLSSRFTQKQFLNFASDVPPHPTPPHPTPIHCIILSVTRLQITVHPFHIAVRYCGTYWRPILYREKFIIDQSVNVSFSTDENGERRGAWIRVLPPTGMYSMWVTGRCVGHCNGVERVSI